VTETTGSMQVDEAWLTRGLRVTVGHRDHGGFLQPKHIVELRSIKQGIDQWQFRGARIAENILAAFAFQDIE